MDLPPNFKLKLISNLLGYAFILGFLACNQATSSQEANIPSLKERYQDYFPIGAAIKPTSVTEDHSLLRLHYASITAENAMKAGDIHPEAGVYNWGPADTIAIFAYNNGMKLRGHTLVWYRNTPRWMYMREDGTKKSPEELMQAMQSHIHEVVSRYKGKIYCWDVVNEAISDTDSLFLRDDSVWGQTFGQRFIDSAFVAAKRADPTCQLFYNDYQLINAQKRAKVIQMITGMRERGIPIDGIGIQAHWDIKNPSKETLQQTIEAFDSLGLKIQFTELDISNYIWMEEDSLAFKAYDTALDSLLAVRYSHIFEVFRKNKDKIDGVTFWNYTDELTWLRHFPIVRPNYPHLFDTLHKPKKAFFKVVDF